MTTPADRHHPETAAQDAFAIDMRLVRRRFETRSGDRPLALLEREIARRMAERLDYIRISPTAIADLGCGSGADLALLGERYPRARRIGLDFAPARLAFARPQRGLLQRLLGRSDDPARPLAVAAHAHALPLARATVDMVWSNLTLNWLSDPQPALAELHRILAVDGMLMFSTLGPDTLRELRHAFDDANGRRVHRFIDMHDIGDVLVRTGFSDPVMDMEVVTLTYPDIDTLLDDLRRSAWNNASTARPRGLTGTQAWQRMRERLGAQFRDGRLPITFEVVQGHAWKAAPKTSEDGRAVIQFQRRPGGGGTR